jgi:hypothetical protein
VNNCPKFGKLIGGCKFEPRYDTKTGAPGEFKTDDAELMSVFFNGLGTSKTYVCDVCVRCGEKVNRT